MAAGKAHWQNGIVERHIGIFREKLNKLFLEDVFEGADAQTTVDHVCESKNRLGSCHGTSPSQWLLGRTRNPLIDAAEASPLLSKGPGFEQHLARRTKAAQQFHAAYAKTYFAHGVKSPITGNLRSSSWSIGLLLPSREKGNRYWI